MCNNRGSVVKLSIKGVSTEPSPLQQVLARVLFLVPSPLPGQLEHLQGWYWLIADSSPTLLMLGLRAFLLCSFGRNLAFYRPQESGQSSTNNLVKGYFGSDFFMSNTNKLRAYPHSVGPARNSAANTPRPLFLLILALCVPTSFFHVELKEFWF